MEYKRKFTNTIVFYGIFLIGFVIVLLWLDEIFDILHFLFGAAQTPINITESIFESIRILITGVFCIGVTTRLLAKIKTLEGRFVICSSCKKIRDNDEQSQNFESYIKVHSNTTFSHDLCQECIEKLYCDEE